VQLSIGFLTPEYVTAQQKDGGLANYLQKIAHELTKRNHRVTIFTLSDRESEWKDGDIQIVEVKSANCPKLPGPIYWRIKSLLPVITQIRSARRIEEAVWRHHKKSQFDILQTSSYRTPGYTLRRNGRIPLVCRISSYTPLWRSAYGRQRSFEEYLTDWLEIKQVLDAENAFSPSDFVADIYEKIEGLRPVIIRTPIESPIESLNESFQRQHFSGLVYYLFIGSLSKIKGIDVLADAIPRVWSDYPDIHFVLVGRDDGMPNWSRAMDYVISKCAGRENQLHYLGLVAKSELYPIIRNAVGVVIPSRVDNYPNVCLEAFSMDTPVIATRCSSLEEMIRHRITGLLVQNGDVEALASAMIQLLNMSDQQKKEIKDNIRKLVEEIVAEQRVEQLIHFYLETIKGYRKK
jgi:glycosyltransferase involved in cell wall biosynthesis